MGIDLTAYLMYYTQMKGKELVKLLEKEGKIVSVPVHNQDLPKGTLSNILKKTGVNL